MNTYHYYAPCPRGLEALLAQELQALGAHGVHASGTGVAFEGPLALCYRANLHSRLASRVLLRVGECDYRREQDVYQYVLGIDWARMFSVDNTIAVSVNAQRANLKSLDFITLRIKDAVCDSFRAACGARPNVDARNPQVRIHAFFSAQRMTLYLDSSGAPLYKRGYRAAAVAAPLKENLAAGILALTGWRPGEVLLDPMCGSGTLLVEAAQIAANRAPGLGRSFGFEALREFDRGIWRDLQHQARQRVQPAAPGMTFGCDRDGAALRAARENLSAAGVAASVELTRRDVLEIDAVAANGVLVTNPPYGERVGDKAELAEFYPRFGDLLKQKFPGWRVYIFSADAQLPKLIGLKTSRRVPLFNGPIECRLYEYRIVAGKMANAAAA